jgi:isopentenyl-diphosphate Delta-isomerase
MTRNLQSHDSNELGLRKQQHIELTKSSQTPANLIDPRFNYEPLFFTHPQSSDNWPVSFLKYHLDFPIWISSMTGGSSQSFQINQFLAKLCGQYKLGMGLGSCRPLLEDKSKLNDFAVRKLLGPQPFFANLGIAQLEELLRAGKLNTLHEMIKTLEADGLIIHLNPLQEWFQPGGDRYLISPLETLKRFLDNIDYPVIIKEVGQGLGPKSLEALLNLPIAAIEFGAFGGTNFSLLESMRDNSSSDIKKPFINVGHTAQEMVDVINAMPVKGKEFIISGGINSVLDGYELMMKLKAPAVLGMASAFLSPAQKGYDSLEQHFLSMKESLLVARQLLSVKGNL